jgi:hypothetical protein
MPFFGQDILLRGRFAPPGRIPSSTEEPLFRGDSLLYGGLHPAGRMLSFGKD